MLSSPGLKTRFSSQCRVLTSNAIYMGGLHAVFIVTISVNNSLALTVYLKQQEFDLCQQQHRVRSLLFSLLRRYFWPKTAIYFEYTYFAKRTICNNILSALKGILPDLE